MEEVLKQIAKALAPMIAEEVIKELDKRDAPPLTVTQFWESMGKTISKQTIRNMVHSGRLARLESTGDRILIPATELARIRQQ